MKRVRVAASLSKGDFRIGDLTTALLKYVRTIECTIVVNRRSSQNLGSDAGIQNSKIEIQDPGSFCLIVLSPIIKLVP